MTTIEKAKEIRKEFKSLGYKNISVRSQYFSGGSAIDITLKSEISETQLQTMNEITKKYERIFRDESTGEILAGGNCYIMIYSHDNRVL